MFVVLELKDIKALNVEMQNKPLKYVNVVSAERGVSLQSLRLHCWFNSLNQQQHVLQSILLYHQKN